MVAAPIPANEEKRLQELYSLELLDTPYEEEFNEIVRIASKICNAPMSIVTLLDSHRQWFKAKVGNLPPETSRSVSFCGHAIMGDGVMEVPNALHDERFYDNPLVTENPNIRFYAGMPLVTQRGYKIGTLCVIDTVPRNLDEDQLESLQTLAKQVMRIIELRVKVRELNELTKVKNKIISIIGHDVRNPLASIKNILQMKEMGFIKGDDEAKFLKMAAEQVDNTISMVSNLAEWGQA
ncbi:MAG TPA: GAF domain-containing protein [Chitinophagaceae bacterium]|nr:GAF domain-containing protein [Chitinophagaceae bacterium]